MPEKTKEKPLRVLCGEWVDTGFGKRLFGRSYQEASAYVMQTERAEAEVCIFDTYAPEDAFEREWSEGARIALYSNHYQGQLEPNVCDLRNLAALPRGTELYLVRDRQCVKWKRK